MIVISKVNRLVENQDSSNAQHFTYCWNVWNVEHGSAVPTEVAIAQNLVTNSPASFMADIAHLMIFIVLYIAVRKPLN